MNTCNTMRSSPCLVTVVAILVCLCSTITPPCSSASVDSVDSVDSVVKHERRGCEYEGKLYPPGAKFRPDPCTRCHCKQRGVRVHCSVEDCGTDTHCKTFQNQTDHCCPKCLEHGCRLSDGTFYMPGEVIRHEACVRCYCPLGGGNPVCDVTECPLSKCVDPMVVPGVCCPVCPNGPNCQIGILTLPIGQSVVIEGAVCTCETFHDLEGEERTMARCNKN